MNHKLNSLLLKLLFSILIALPVFASVEAKADNHTDMPHDEMNHGDMEMKQESEPDGVYNSIDGGVDGEPVVTVTPTEETVNVKLINGTNAAIDYQAIGYTENQTLEGGEKHTMINLPVPVVIRTARQDDGFIKILPLTDKDRDGVLEVTLEEDPDFYDDDNLGVLRIEDDGSVYVN